MHQVTLVLRCGMLGRHQFVGSGRPDERVFDLRTHMVRAEPLS